MLFVVYIAFLIKGYVLICFYHSFCNFLVKKPPCCEVLLVSVGIGVVLHVFVIVSNIFWIVWSNCEHADCHWFSVSWSNERRLVILLNWIAFSSKKMVLNFSTFSWGIGFIILVI